MDISRHIAEISRDIAFYQRAVNFPLFVIHLLDDPDAAGDRYFVPRRRGLDDRTQFLGSGMNLVLDVLLKDRVELVVIRDPLSCDPYHQPAVLRAVDMVDLQQVPQ